ncbi:MAG TPA: hypothetical protein PKX93_02860 [bacterium]|nr:hypothetical protein [bacterium]
MGRRKETAVCFRKEKAKSSVCWFIDGATPSVPDGAVCCVRFLPARKGKEIETKDVSCS